jgi:hypothetical protein
LKNVKTYLTSKKLPGFNVDRGSYLALVLGFLLGRTTFAESLSPFGPSVYAGARGVGGSAAVFAGLGALAGSITLGRWDILGYHALAMALSTFLIKPKARRNYPPALDALIAGASIAVSRAIVNIIHAPALYAYIFALLEGLCAVILSILAKSAFAKEKEAQAQVERSSEAVLVLGLLSVGGLVGLEVWGFPLATVAVMASTLLAGYGAGPGAGAIAGLAGGMVLTLTGMEMPEIIGMLGVSGVLAGVGGWFGKTESALGCISAGLLMSLYSNSLDSSAALQRLFAQSVACLPLFLMTPKMARAFSARFPVLSQVKRPDRPRLVADPTRLRAAAVSQALTEIGEMLSQSSAAVLPQEGDVNPLSSASAAAPLRQVAERVCRECEREGVCWKDEFGDTYEAFSDFVRQTAISGQISSATDNSGLADRCIRFPEVLAEINHYRELERLRQRVKVMDGETKECLAFQYKCLAQLLSPRTPVPKDEPKRPHKPRLKVTIKGDTLPADGGSKPGDMWVKYDLGPNRVMAILVDGMGKGEKAARESRDTIDILKSLLDCGLDYDSCISFLNSALFLSCRPDGFVAVDCLLIDHDTERAYFHKLGSPPSFIRKKDGNVLVVRAQKPPAGAFSSMPSFSTSEPIAPGDTILMVSDGVFRSSPIPARAEHHLVSKIRRSKDESPETLLKTLIGYGQRMRVHEIADDVTVVVARIDRA